LVLFLSILIIGSGHYDVISGKFNGVIYQIAHLNHSLEKFFADINRYPTTQEGLNILVKNTSNLSNWKGPYLKEDILNSHFNGKIIKDKWGNEFVYLCPPQYRFGNNPYNLYSKGKNQLDDYAGKDDITTWKKANKEKYYGEEAKLHIDQLSKISGLLLKITPFLILLLIVLKSFLRKKAK
jgi:general secretion pathway protein G